MGGSPHATSLTGSRPYLDTTYFVFGYGDTSNPDPMDNRFIDAQYATQTLYVANTNQLFGVNFADGRIKGYPTGTIKPYYVKYVRGTNNYGIHDFVDNGDGTITDNATGLMWTKSASGTGVVWEDALSYAENATTAGYTDWRLPDPKELQSIVDYTRSPNTTSSAAIDPVFNCTSITNEAGQPDYPFYRTSTIHLGIDPQFAYGYESACYIAFGRALGKTGPNWTDIHGAGRQRSEFKTGDPSNYPNGLGPQGDAVRIYNYVRIVRNSGTSGINENQKQGQIIFYPNPGAVKWFGIFFVSLLYLQSDLHLSFHYC